MLRQYFVNWWLYLRGFTMLHTIPYKPGWSAWGWKPFWFVYLTTYLAGVLIGAGVVSLSQFWWERSRIIRDREGMNWDRSEFMVPHPVVTGERWAHPFSRFMTRFLNWLLPGKVHGALTGPRLWGSQPCGWWK